MAAALVAALLAMAGVYVVWPWLDELFLRLPGFDKVVHFAGGAGLWTLSFLVAGRAMPHSAARHRVLAAAVVTSSIICLDELAQSSSAARTVEWQDLVSGLAGLTFAAVCAAGIPRGAVRLGAALLALVTVSLTVCSTYLLNRNYFAGILLERAARYEEAYEAYSRALQQERPPPGVYNNIAWLSIETLDREYDNAVRWARRGVELDPDDPNVRDTLAWAQYKTGDLASAREHIELAAEWAPENVIIQDHWKTIENALASDQTVP